MRQRLLVRQAPARVRSIREPHPAHHRPVVRPEVERQRPIRPGLDPPGRRKNRKSSRCGPRVGSESPWSVWGNARWRIFTDSAVPRSEKALRSPPTTTAPVESAIWAMARACRARMAESAEGPMGPTSKWRFPTWSDQARPDRVRPDHAEASCAIRLAPPKGSSTIMSRLSGRVESIALPRSSGSPLGFRPLPLRMARPVEQVEPERVGDSHHVQARPFRGASDTRRARCRILGDPVGHISRLRGWSPGAAGRSR